MPEKSSRLPKLRPNVNKRAQQIITAHLQLEDSRVGTVSNASVPVLSKLERSSATMKKALVDSLTGGTTAAA
eukprot:g6081.t1